MAPSLEVHIRFHVLREMLPPLKILGLTYSLYSPIGVTRKRTGAWPKPIPDWPETCLGSKHDLRIFVIKVVQWINVSSEIQLNFLFQQP